MTQLIAGIGNSAGGLEAVTELLRGLPKSTGIAFIEVQHMDPHREGQLSEPVRPDHVYVILPGTTLR